MARASTTADDGKRRRPADGGYARGDETRTRIIAAALEVFGLHGFEGASTRMLAEKAGVTLPALHYYFDSKQGVYLACAEHIAERMQARLGAVTSRIEEALARKEQSRLCQTLLAFLDELVELFLGAHELEKWVLFIIREQAHPTKAFDILYERMMRRVAGLCTALLARLADKPESDKEVRVRALALIGQIVFFRTAREATLRVLGWPDFENNRLALVKSTLRAQVASGLEAARKSKRRSKS